MIFYVAVTDNDWFRYLRDLPEVDEVNFWRPGSPRTFKAVPPGGPFLFKLHHPENYIVGGGYFTTYSVLPVSLAWEAFEEKNGAPSREIMLEQIGKYRRSDDSGRANYDIGCVILTEPFFFAERDWIPAPPDFAKNIVSGKGYDLEMETGRKLWEQVQLRLAATGADAAADADASAVPDLFTQLPHTDSASLPNLYGDPTLYRPRLGQGAFRILVTDTYHRRCAVTGEKALPTLEAAHIRPVSKSGQHRVDNGLLLRADVHKLFDGGYVTVTPDYRIRVSRRLKDEFDNGEPYYPFDGRELWLPPKAEKRPSREYLEWHSDTVFQS